MLATAPIDSDAMIAHPSVVMPIQYLRSKLNYLNVFTTVFAQLIHINLFSNCKFCSSSLKGLIALWRCKTAQNLHEVNFNAHISQLSNSLTFPSFIGRQPAAVHRHSDHV